MGFDFNLREILVIDKTRYNFVDNHGQGFIMDLIGSDNKMDNNDIFIFKLPVTEDSCLYYKYDTTKDNRLRKALEEVGMSIETIQQDLVPYIL